MFSLTPQLCFAMLLQSVIATVPHRTARARWLAEHVEQRLELIQATDLTPLCLRRNQAMFGTPPTTVPVVTRRRAMHAVPAFSLICSTWHVPQLCFPPLRLRPFVAFFTPAGSPVVRRRFDATACCLICFCAATSTIATAAAAADVVLMFLPVCLAASSHRAVKSNNSMEWCSRDGESTWAMGGRPRGRPAVLQC